METLFSNISISHYQKPKAPNGEFNATVNLIEEAGLFQGNYKRGYWSKKVKQSGISFLEMERLLKDIEGMDSKYNKGGFLTNKLSINKK